MPLPRALFNCNVWGRDFIRRFVDLVLPCQLAEGNLGGLAGAADGLYLIGTTAADRPAIEAAPAMRALSRLMPVAYLTDVDHEFHKYRVLNQYQKLAMIRAVAEDFSVYVPLYADQIYAEGSFDAALRRIGAGALAVLAQGPRALQAGIASAIIGRTGPAGAARIRPRDLVRHFLDNRHPFEDAFFADADRFSSYPSHVQWRVGDEGCVVHNFHLHPVALRVLGERPRFTAGFRETLDGSFLDELLRPDDPVHVVADSDEIFMCSTEDDPTLGHALVGDKPFDIADLALFALRYIRPFGFRMWTHTCIYRTGEVDSAAWRETTQTARHTANQLLAIVEEIRRRTSTSD